MEDKVKIWSGQAGAAGPAAAPCPTCTSSVSFPRRFTAWHLQFLASFKIRWTNNLSDHLLILDNEVDLAVYIFHQSPPLLSLIISSKIMSEDLILETFDTLALLFPRTDRMARLWYQQLQEKYNLDPGVFRCTYIKMEDCEIRHFKHWGPRLLKIKRAFDDHEPNGPVQWWRDDRKPVQWWTFWTAVLVLVLTVVFGVIQSVASILQVIHR
ncbi:hypothetical protein DL95DRAFT_374508 [Leptodontidium sp. 2 PMI_412]|nr:hypothetical protein DL95DRAFT_374508 [Leptodontidium sp. 2 PMI_412]